MIGVDTNVLLRWIAADVVDSEGERYHSELIEKFMTGSSEPIHINHVVLVETAWVLRRRAHLSKDILIDVINALLHSTDVVIGDREAVASALSAYGGQPGDFPDHLIGEINRRHGCRTTITFDRAAALSPHFTELRS